jgi:hypothetical protein
MLLGNSCWRGPAVRYLVGGASGRTLAGGGRVPADSVCRRRASLPSRSPGREPTQNSPRPFGGRGPLATSWYHHHSPRGAGHARLFCVCRPATGPQSVRRRRDGVRDRRALSGASRGQLPHAPRGSPAWLRGVWWSGWQRRSQLGTSLSACHSLVHRSPSEPSSSVLPISIAHAA